MYKKYLKKYTIYKNRLLLLLLLQCIIIIIIIIIIIRWISAISVF